MKKLMILGSLAFLAACGDPRGYVDGAYSVTITTVVDPGTASASSATAVGNLTIANDPSNSSQITFSGACGLTGTMSGGSGFTINPGSCSLTDGTCNYVETITGGSGTVSGKSLTMSYGGTEAYSCNNGNSGSGVPFTVSITGSKP